MRKEHSVKIRHFYNESEKKYLVYMKTKKIRLFKIQQNLRDGCILYIIVVNPDGVQCTCTQSQTSPLLGSTPSSALPVSL